MTVHCRVTGLSSLFMDGTQGTPAERHVFFADLDSTAPGEDPAGFRRALAVACNKFRVSRVYLFRTLKGYHAFSPCLAPRRITERWEEALEGWGSDGFHRFMSYRNGQAIMRVDAKPGEGEGPRLVRTYRLAASGGVRDWSGPHMDFMQGLHPHMLAMGPLSRRVDGGGDVRLERYDTTALETGMVELRASGGVA